MAADQENTVQSQQEVQKSLKDLQEKHKTLISKLDSHLESVLDQTSMSRHVLETSAKNMASIFDKALEAFKSSTAIIDLRLANMDHDPWMCRIHEHLETKPATTKDVRNAILKTFRYPSMKIRHEMIPEAHAKTFRWALSASRSHGSWDSLIDWLDSDDDLYWITGKAASGKSTFMKYLIQEPMLRGRLEEWAGAKRLLCASFFFWNLGNSTQKSQVGLLLSLLHAVLTEQDNLLEEVFPELYEQLLKSTVGKLNHLGERWHQWSLTELNGIWGRLSDLMVSQNRFCFFIDGLDEFSGHGTDIAAFVLKIAQLPNVKVCVSSRPLMVFEQEFESCKKLRLHDLTREDIRLYIQDRLGRHKRFAEVTSSAPKETDELTTKILDMSSGVFLWVSLVVQSLLDGLTNHDSLSDLHARLLELPPELHDLYHLMMRSITPLFYMAQASRLLQIVTQAVKPLPVLALSFADEDDTNLAVRAKIRPWPAEDCERRIKSMTAKITSRCKGLLEVRQSHRGYEKELQNEVHFLHLTVKEFLERPEIWKELLAHTAETTFNSNISLLHGSLFILKTVRSQYAWSGTTDQCIEDTMQYAVAAEDSVNKPQVALVDSIDEAAAFLVSQRPVLRHWTEYIQLESGWNSPVTSFVTYAISRGLALYVQAKYGNRLLSLNRSAKFPLLAFAVDYDAGENEPRSPRPSMVSMLLKVGLSTNHPFEESTIWLRLLADLVVATEQDATIDTVWATVCKLLLLHGADITALVTFKRQRPHRVTMTPIAVTEAIDFIFSRGSHETFLEMREIVAGRERASRAALAPRSKKRKRHDILAVEQ